MNNRQMLGLLCGQLDDLIKGCDDVAAGIGPGRDNGAAEVVLAKRKIQEAAYWLIEAKSILVTKERAVADTHPAEPRPGDKVYYQIFEATVPSQGYLFPEIEDHDRRNTKTLTDAVRDVIDDGDELQRLADELAATIDANRERAWQQRELVDRYDTRAGELPNSQRERED